MQGDFPGRTEGEYLLPARTRNQELPRERGRGAGAAHSIAQNPTPSALATRASVRMVGLTVPCSSRCQRL